MLLREMHVLESVSRKVNECKSREEHGGKKAIKSHFTTCMLHVPPSSNYIIYMHSISMTSPTVTELP